MSNYGHCWTSLPPFLVACCMMVQLCPTRAAEAGGDAVPVKPVPVVAPALAPAEGAPAAAPVTVAEGAPAAAPVTTAEGAPVPVTPLPVIPAGDGPAHSGLALLQLLQREGALPVLPAGEEQLVLDDMLLLTRAPAVLMTSPTIPSVAAEWLVDIGGTVDHTLARLRISSLDCAYPEELAAFQLALQQGDYHGVILDLRSVDGQDKAVADALGATLGAAAVPVIVLIDADTCGMAESLACSLQQQGAFVMGEPSRGIPGPGRVVPFRDGLYLRLPLALRAAEKASAVRAVFPDRDLSAVELAGDGDPWVKQASDTLVAIMVLKRKPNE